MTTLTDLLDLPSGAAADTEVPMWIDGRAVASVNGSAAARDDVCPSTGSVLARVHQASAADVDRAVAAAARSQPEWAAMGIHERAARLAEWGRRVVEAAPRLGLLDARDGGTAVTSMAASAAKGGKFLQTIAGVAPELGGRTIPATPTGLHFTEPAPWGVVAALCAYNHPTLFTCMKAAPALAAGNSVVLKPAPQSPLSPLVVASLASDLLPPGVLNVVPGGVAAGEALVAHPDVPRVSFTGSLRTGLAVQARAGASGVLKSLTLELGGKNPILIFDDVDPDTAAAAVVKGSNFARVGGQSCGATSRLLIHASQREAVLERVVESTEQIRIGMPDDPSSDMGCMVSHAHRDRILGFVDAGHADGGRLLTGGTPPVDPHLAAGAFIRPAVFDNVDHHATIARTEIFGPVLAVTSFTDAAEAVAMANDTPYGLTASIWSNDVNRALGAARAIDAGYVWVNDVEVRYPGLPFGGWKQSGIGKELGLVDDILSHTRSKAISIAITPARSEAERIDGSLTGISRDAERGRGPSGP